MAPFYSLLELRLKVDIKGKSKSKWFFDFKVNFYVFLWSHDMFQARTRSKIGCRKLDATTCLTSSFKRFIFLFFFLLMLTICQSLCLDKIHIVLQCKLKRNTYVQVNNYEIVVNFFHISHNLTWYSAIVHKFTRIYPVCSTYELTKQFM